MESSLEVIQQSHDVGLRIPQKEHFTVGLDMCLLKKTVAGLTQWPELPHNIKNPVISPVTHVIGGLLSIILIT